MNKEEMLSQLESIREHCKSMIPQDEPDSVWRSDVEALDMAVSVLRAQPQWISVEDRLPGRYETVLIAIATVNGYGDPAQLVTIGGYDHSEKRWEQYTSTDRQLCLGETVTHWMPLPEKPEEAKTDDV